jgi:hypothetical protein
MAITMKVAALLATMLLVAAAAYAVEESRRVCCYRTVTATESVAGKCIA